MLLCLATLALAAPGEVARAEPPPCSDPSWREILAEGRLCVPGCAGDCAPGYQAEACLTGIPPAGWSFACSARAGMPLSGIVGG